MKVILINAIGAADFEIEQVLGHSNFADDEIEDDIRDADAAEYNADIEGELLNACPADISNVQKGLDLAIKYSMLLPGNESNWEKKDDIPLDDPPKLIADRWIQPFLLVLRLVHEERHFICSHFTDFFKNILEINSFYTL